MKGKHGLCNIGKFRRQSGAMRRDRLPRGQFGRDAAAIGDGIDQAIDLRLGAGVASFSGGA